MKITFLHHSSYALETEKALLLFDITEKSLPLIPKTEKPTLFFTTHGHGDHFTAQIFEEEAAHFFVGISTPAPKRGDITILHPGETLRTSGDFCDEELLISAFGSTDEGVSLLLTLDGKTIYYSGDLAYWVWPRYDETDITNMEREYTTEVEKARQALEGHPADVAFVVVDPRLGEDYRRGVAIALEKLQPRDFFSLHTWGKYSMTTRVQEDFQKDYPETTFHPLTASGDSFLLP